MSIYSWGGGSLGGLGHGCYEDKAKATVIESLEDEDIVQVACGWSTCLALSAHGHVYEWGWRKNLKSMNFSQRFRRRFPLIFSRLQSITIPLFSKITFRRAQTTPTLVKGIEFPIVKIASGGEFCAAVTAGGRLYTWGVGIHGQLGRGGKKISLFFLLSCLLVWSRLLARLLYFAFVFVFLSLSLSLPAHFLCSLFFRSPYGPRIGRGSHG